MVKSAFYNQNEDLLKNASEQVTIVPEMFSETKYSNVEENNLLNKPNLSSKPKNQDMSNTQDSNNLLANENESLFEELLGMRYKPELSEGLEPLKNEVLLDSLSIFPQLNSATHLNDLNANNFNSSLDFVDNFKVYDKSDSFFNGFLNTNNVSSNNLNKFEPATDKLDTKEVQLDKNLVNSTACLASDNLDNSLTHSDLNRSQAETLPSAMATKAQLENLYDSFNLTASPNELNGLYGYFDAANYTAAEPSYASDASYPLPSYYPNEVGCAGNASCDDLLAFSEFEKGLVSLCDESTQQGASLMASPAQENPGGEEARDKDCLSSSSTEKFTTQPSKDSFASCLTDRASVASEASLSYSNLVFGGAPGLAAQKPGARGGSGFSSSSTKDEFYGASTSFVESTDGSYDSAYKMDSLAQSLLCDSSYSGEFYDAGSKYDSSANDYESFYDSSCTPYAKAEGSVYASPSAMLKSDPANAGGLFKDSLSAAKSFKEPVSVVDPYSSVAANPYASFFSLNANTPATFDQYKRPEYYGDEKSFFRDDRHFFKDEGYYGDEKREDDATPFTHVASSVATVADTVTPLCSSDLNAEFAETVQVLLERYLVGDLSAETELYSLFSSEFNLERGEVYNNLVKYCTGKNLLYYSYKLLLQSTRLLEALEAGFGAGAYVDKYHADKCVSVEVYTQTLLSLLTVQDSTHLSRSLFTHLTSYSNNTHEKGGNAALTHSTPAASAPAVTKEGDKVLRLYTLSISQLTKRDPAMFDRFLSVLEDHQGRLDLRLSSLLLSYVLHADLAAKKQFESWMNLAPADAICCLIKIFRISLFPRLGTSVRFTLHFLDLMLNPAYSVEFVENARTLILFLEFVTTHFPLSYSKVVLKLIEKKLFNALLFFNSLQLALLCDYGSMVTKICVSALQVLKGVVPVEFTSPTFGRFEFISLENVNKLVLLISNYYGGSPAGAKSINALFGSVAGAERPKELNGVAGGMFSLSQEPSSVLASNLLDVCKTLFGSNKKELFVPLVECCLLVEDFQGAECIMKYYCDYYGMVSEPICEKMLLSIALKGNFNYVNRLLKGTQSYESCEVFLTHSSSQNKNDLSADDSGSHAPNKASPSHHASGSNRNGLVRLSIYLVRICISMLNFNMAMNYVKPLLRLNQQNEEISNTLMMVATRLDSRSKLDSFLSFCERTSILINESCFNVILDSCIKLKNNKRLLRIIGKFRVWGLYPNIQTFGIIIKGLSSCNMIQECEELFYNYLTYTSHLKALSQAAQNHHASDSHSHANGAHKDRNHAPHSAHESSDSKSADSSYSTSSSHNSHSQAGSANSLAHTNSSVNPQLSKEKERINEIIYGCMFDAYVNNNKVDSAMRLFEDMKVRGQVKPNTIMYTTLIKGYGQNKQLDKAMKIFRMMQQDQVVPNTVTYNSIIDACARVGDMSGATSLLEDMLMNDIEPDLITFSTIIKGYCVQSDMDKSFQLLSIMYERGIMPDVILYNSLLEGCVKSGLLWLCEKLWKQMQDYDIPPSNFTLTILIKMYGRSGHLDKVFELADELPKKYNFSINTHVYTCLMSACITNGKYGMVLDIYKYMKKNGVKPDAKTFETIIQGLSRGGLFREAAQVVMEVYSLSNSNHGEAQISNINSKVLERLFQRFNTYMSSPQSNAQYKDSKESGKDSKDRLKKGAREDLLLNMGGGSYKGASYSGCKLDELEELASLYTSLNRRLELFGIKIPKF